MRMFIKSSSAKNVFTYINETWIILEQQKVYMHLLIEHIHVRITKYAGEQARVNIYFSFDLHYWLSGLNESLYLWYYVCFLKLIQVSLQ